MSSFTDYVKQYNNTKKKNKKDEEEQQGQSFTDYVADYNKKKTEVIAPVKEKSKKKGDLEFFQKGSGNIVKDVLGTTGDVALGVTKGALGLVEGAADLLGYGVAGVADLFGADEWADEHRDMLKQSFVNQITKGADDFLDKYSVLGDTSDSIAEGLGQVAAIILTGGVASAAGASSAAVSAITSGTMFASSMGSGIGEAYEGGATDGQAALYGFGKGVVDAGTEMLFGGLGKGVKALGLSKGISSLDDVFAKKISSKISNQFFKNLTEFGVKSSFEGAEEVLSGLGTATMKKLTYMDDDKLSQLVKDENLLEQFVVGTVTSSLAQSGIVPGMKNGSLREANAEGRDFITGLNKNEQSVIDKVYKDDVEQAEKQNGKKLTKKEKTELYDKVLEKLERGEISTDTIEEVLGGETYKSYKGILDQEKADIQELAELYEGEELNQQITDYLSNSKRNEIGSQLSKEVFELVKDGKLAESYFEKSKRGKAFEADLTQYDEKYQVTIKKAVESGILNNTRRTHEFVDLIAKISADKGVLFDFANNEKIANSRFAVEGKTVNGYVDGDNVVLNIDSAKALESTVGHEITHILEGTELYDTFQEVAFEYAKSKKSSNSKFENEYKERLYNTRELYKNVDGYQGAEGFKKIKREVVADLVGDYIFTDADFVRKLSAENRNVFEKIYDEVKYLCKVATAGSKEARELEKVKKTFAEVYRGEATKKSGTAYSISEKKSVDESTHKIIERLNNGEDVSIEEINATPTISQLLDDAFSRPETYTIDTPERNTTRKEVVKKLLTLGSATVDRTGKVWYNGGVKQERRADIVIGLSAAGKSSVLVNPLSEYYSSRIIDSDMAKEELDEFDNGLGANAVHRESQDIIKSVLEYSVLNGDNIVYPIVGGGDINSLINKINSLKNEGYSVYLHLNELPNSKAIGRSLNRYIEKGRFIPPEVIKRYGDTPTKNFNTIINTGGLVDGYSHYSNDVNRDEKPKLIEISENVRQFDERGHSISQSTRENKTAQGTKNTRTSKIAPIKETSPKGGVFSLSAEQEIYFKDSKVRDENGIAPIKRGNFNTHGEAVKLKAQNNIAPVKNNNLEANADKQHISLEEFADKQNSIWRSVDYSDDATKKKITRETHDIMVNNGDIVQVSEQTMKDVAPSFPDLRGMKKKERTPILKESMNKLKENIRQFLNGFKNQNFEFEVNGKVLEARLYGTGINEVLEKVTQEKANMLYTTEAIFKNAHYLYSTDDYSSDPNVYRWNYFYTPVQIGEDVVGVRIAVRDLLEGQNHTPESQIYNWGIKKDASLDGAQPVNKDSSRGISSDASTYFIPDADENVKVENVPNTESHNIAPIRETTEQTTPKNSAPVRTTKQQHEKQSKWVETSTESEAVSRKVLPDDLDQDSIHYEPISNKVILGKANERLDRMGYESSVTYFNSQFANDKISLEDIALGERLIQEAIKRGDTVTAGELIQDVAILGRELGQKVQALSIIKRLTPEGQLRMLQKIIERGKTKGDKAFEGVELTQDMTDKILNTYNADGTYDQAKLNAAVEEVKQEIADQMKITWLEIVNAWRFLAMLGNPKTHIRNLVSNIAMRGALTVKNALARTIEDIAPIKNRTKTWKRATQEVKTFARETAFEMKDILTDGDKYSEASSIKEKRKIFKNKILNAMYEGNSDLLTKEDWWFTKPAFINAFSEFLTANGIRTEQDIANNPKIVEMAKQYATEQSQIATFRQYSWLANKINEMEHNNSAANIAIGSTVPFKKTPINIAKTGVSYSPLGFAKTLTYDVKQVKNGNMEASELIDHLSQNVTGTALTLVGYFLASLGFLSGGGDDDKEGQYDSNLGEQTYSINIDGKAYSLSWLSPVAMPLFVGANAYEQLVEGEEWNGDVVVQTLAETLDPLSEMSFLSGLDSVLSSYDSGIEKFAGIGKSMAQNYITQFAPTLLSQAATAMDDTKRSTKVAGNSGFKFFDETINNIKLKIPYLRQTLEPSTDIWGNDVKLTENTLTRAFETFIAPYSVREKTATAIDEEIKELYSETGDSGLIPNIPQNYINYKDEKLKMSAEEYTAFKKTYGQTAYGLIKELFETQTYQKASHEDRTDMVNKVYDYARDEAKREFLAKKGVEYTNAKKDGVEYYKENLIKGAIKYDMSTEEYDYFIQSPKKHAVAKSVGGYNAYKNYSSKLNGIFADKNASGMAVSGSRKRKVANYINSLDIDYGAKIILYKSQYPSDDMYNYAIVNYLNSREDISYDEMESILVELGFTVLSDGTVRW